MEVVADGDDEFVILRDVQKVDDVAGPSFVTLDYLAYE